MQVLERLDAVRIEAQGGSEILRAVTAEVDAWLGAEAAVEKLDRQQQMQPVDRDGA